MDFLYKTFDQLRDLWKSMTPSARLASGLMAGVIIVSSFWLVRGTPEKSDHSLFGGRELSQSEIAKMVSAFSQANLSGWEIVGNRIHVPGAQKHKYLAALAEANVLPDNAYSDFDEAFARDNPFTSQASVKAQFALAKQKQVAKTIQSLQGIEHAVVVYDETLDRGFPRTKNASASVTVHTKTNEPLSEQQVRAIRALVVSAYSGLKPSNVAITDAKAGRAYEGPPDDGTAGASHALYREEKDRNDRLYEERIRRALSMIPGVLVTANTTLSPVLLQQTRTTRYEPKTVPVSQKDITEERQNSFSGPAGVPGAIPNGVNTNSQPVSVGRTADVSKESKTISESQNVVGATETLERKPPLIPVNVTASISVPAKYFLEVWKAQNPTPPGQPAKTPTPEELKAIETTIKKEIEATVEKQLPPVAPGEESFPRIHVTTYQDLPAEAPPAPTWVDWVLPWAAANWQAVGLGVLGLVGVVVLRSMFAATALPEAPAVVVEEKKEEEESQEAPPPGVITQLRERFTSTGPTLREELQSLVKQDPEAAASVLRNWIGEAA